MSGFEDEEQTKPPPRLRSVSPPLTLDSPQIPPTSPININKNNNPINNNNNNYPFVISPRARALNTNESANNKKKKKVLLEDIDSYEWDHLSLAANRKTTAQKFNVWNLMYAGDNSNRAPPPRHRSTMVLAQSENFKRLVVFGGSQTIDAFKDVWEFSLRDMALWKKVEFRATDFTPPELYFHSAVEYKGSMYIFGGYDKKLEKNCNRIFRFDIVARSWEEIKGTKNIPSERSGHSATVWKDQMLVFGGFDGKARLNDLHSFNLLTHEWVLIETSGETPSSRMNFGACVFKKELYIYSGHSGSTSTNDFFKLSLLSWEWTKIQANNPGKRHGHTLIATEESLILFGGTTSDQQDSNSEKNQIFAFDPLLCRWTKIIPVRDIPGRAYHSALYDAEDRRMITFGGTVMGSKNFTANLFSFPLLPRPPPSTLQVDLLNLFTNSALADLQLISSSGKGHLVHKAVVAARCGYFALQLMGTQLQKKPVVAAKELREIDTLGIDISSDLLSVILEFLYTDNFDLQKLKLQDITTLVATARSWSLEKMISLGENHLCASLDVQNVIEILKRAHHEKWTYVVDACFRFIIQNYSKIVLQEDFAGLPQEVLVNLIRAQHTTKNSDPLPPQVVPEGTLIEDLASIFTELDFADFELKVGEHRLKCHKAVLAARSEYFRALFANSMKDSTSHSHEIVIGNYVPSLEAATCFLEFLYTDKLINSTTFHISAETSVYLLRMSSYFSLKSHTLFWLCSDLLEKEFSPKNCFQVLEAARQTENTKLYERVLTEICSHLNELDLLNLETGLECLEKDALVEIVKGIVGYVKDKKLTYSEERRIPRNYEDFK